MHRIRRNELKVRVSENKIKLGEYVADKKGREHWVDGTLIR